MAPKNKPKPKYPIREAGPEDAIELLGIIGGAGGGEKIGDAIGIAMEAYQGTNTGNTAIRAAVVAITDGLHTALRDRAVRVDAIRFIYSLWAPKFTLEEGEEYDKKKAAEWAKLPMRAPLEIVDAFRKSDQFADFLEFFTSMLPEPKKPEPKDSGDKSTGSKGHTGSEEQVS